MPKARSDVALTHVSVERIDLLPPTPAITARAAALQAARGGDPADWMIAATAQDLQLRLVTKVERLHEAGIVDVAW